MLDCSAAHKTSHRMFLEIKRLFIALSACSDAELLIAFIFKCFVVCDNADGHATLETFRFGNNAVPAVRDVHHKGLIYDMCHRVTRACNAIFSDIPA